MANFFDYVIFTTITLKKLNKNSKIIYFFTIEVKFTHTYIYICCCNKFTLIQDGITINAFMKEIVIYIFKFLQSKNCIKFGGLEMEI